MTLANKVRNGEKKLSSGQRGFFLFSQFLGLFIVLFLLKAYLRFTVKLSAVVAKAVQEDFVGLPPVGFLVNGLFY